jgi:pimeloyl-ACP methyl ester carboxylesterase
MKSKWLALFAVCAVAALTGTYYALDIEINILDQAERERLGGNYIQLSDGVAHYELGGPKNGTVVILVHGGTVPMWVWDRQVEALVDAGYRVLRYDQFGRGYSDRPDVEYDKALYARQLIELVDTLVLPETFDLIGVSFGAATSVSVAAKHPERVRSLSLISPVINNFEVPGIFRVPVLGEFAARLIGIDIIVKRFARLVEGSPDAERYNRLFIEQASYEGFQRSLLSFLRSDALRDYSSEYQIVGRQNVPSLLIWGTEDDEISRDMIDSIRSYIPDLAFARVNDAGHGIVLQKPEIVTYWILDFLAGVEEAKSTRDNVSFQPLRKRERQ